MNAVGALMMNRWTMVEAVAYSLNKYAEMCDWEPLPEEGYRKVSSLHPRLLDISNTSNVLDVQAITRVHICATEQETQEWLMRYKGGRMMSGTYLMRKGVLQLRLCAFAKHIVCCNGMRSIVF